MFELINETLKTSMQKIEKQQLMLTQEKIQETFESLKNENQGDIAPSIGERIAALEKAIADLALLFNIK